MSLSILIKSFQYRADNDIKQTAKDLNCDTVSFYRCFIKNDKGFKHDIPWDRRHERPGGLLWRYISRNVSSGSIYYVITWARPKRQRRLWFTIEYIRAWNISYVLMILVNVVTYTWLNLYTGLVHLCK